MRQPTNSINLAMMKPLQLTPIWLNLVRKWLMNGKKNPTLIYLVRLD